MGLMDKAKDAMGDEEKTDAGLDKAKDAASDRVGEDKAQKARDAADKKLGDEK